jgi:hypothetical protein
MKTKLNSTIVVILVIIVILVFFIVLAVRQPLYKAKMRRPTGMEPPKEVDHRTMAEPPSSDDPLSAIDRILEKLEVGNISFNAPQSMYLNESTMIHLALGVEKTIEDLKQIIEGQGEKIGASIHVSNRMQARLTGQNFEILAITPEEQVVSRSGITEWKWDIKPVKTGTQSLHLTLSAKLIVEGKDTWKAIDTFDKEIKVTVTLAYKAKAFIRKNWQWLWAAVLVPIAGWFLTKKRRSKSGSGSKPAN